MNCEHCCRLLKAKISRRNGVCGVCSDMLNTVGKIITAKDNYSEIKRLVVMKNPPEHYIGSTKKYSISMRLDRVAKWETNA